MEIKKVSRQHNESCKWKEGPRSGLLRLPCLHFELSNDAQLHNNYVCTWLWGRNRTSLYSTFSRQIHDVLYSRGSPYNDLLKPTISLTLFLLLFQWKSLDLYTMKVHVKRWNSLMNISGTPDTSYVGWMRGNFLSPAAENGGITESLKMEKSNWRRG